MKVICTIYFHNGGTITINDKAVNFNIPPTNTLKITIEEGHTIESPMSIVEPIEAKEYRSEAEITKRYNEIIRGNRGG